MRRLLIRSRYLAGRANSQLSVTCLRHGSFRVVQTRFNSSSSSSGSTVTPKDNKTIHPRSDEAEVGEDEDDDDDEDDDEDGGDDDDMFVPQDIDRELQDSPELREAMSMLTARTALTPEQKENLLDKYDNELIEAIQYFTRGEPLEIDYVASGLDHFGYDDKKDEKGDKLNNDADDDDEDSHLDPVLSKKHFLTIQKAAEAGVDEALYECGQCHAQGLGTPINEEEAVRYLKLAADSGLGRAEATWGWMCLHSALVPQDHSQALRYLTLASDKGVPHAHASLASCYLYGWGTEKDLVKAHDLHVQAAKGGVKESLHSLGYMLGNGLGVEKNDASALAHFELAAQQGLADSHYMAGMMLSLGRGREINEETEANAFVHFMAAERKGHPEATCAAGLALLTREDRSSQSVVGGFKLVKKAADLGLSKAQYCVGMMKLGLVGEKEVEVDHKEGLKYTRMAADQGHPSALKYFEHVQKFKN